VFGSDALIDPIADGATLKELFLNDFLLPMASSLLNPASSSDSSVGLFPLRGFI
jgi:hypothetical protein